MSLVNFKAQNHPQQTGKRGARPEVDNLATPPEMFEPLHERFRFTIDVAALPHNRKVPRYFAPNDALPHREDAPVGYDGLAQPWTRERVWCNPPYSALEPWLEKAWTEWKREREPDGTGRRMLRGAPDLIVMLVPANRCEQGWWQRHVEPFRDQPHRGGTLRTEFIAGRPRFIKHGFDRVEPNQRPPFGCCLLIWERA